MVAEEKIIKISVILNDLKTKINPGYNNKLYQVWLKSKKKMNFRTYVIEEAKKNIINVLDTESQ